MQVIATVGGPLTKTVEQLAELLRAGMTVARFDFQQGSISLAEHQRTLENLKAAGKLTSCMCAVYCSLGGRALHCVTFLSLTFVAGCRRLSPVVPEPTEGIPLHNSKTLELS